MGLLPVARNSKNGVDCSGEERVYGDNKTKPDNNWICDILSSKLTIIK